VEAMLTPEQARPLPRIAILGSHHPAAAAMAIPGGACSKLGADGTSGPPVPIGADSRELMLQVGWCLSYSSSLRMRPDHIPIPKRELAAWLGRCDKPTVLPIVQGYVEHPLVSSMHWTSGCDDWSWDRRTLGLLQQFYHAPLPTFGKQSKLFGKATDVPFFKREASIGKGAGKGAGKLLLKSIGKFGAKHPPGKSGGHPPGLFSGRALPFGPEDHPRSQGRGPPFPRPNRPCPPNPCRALKCPSGWQVGEHPKDPCKCSCRKATKQPTLS